MTTTVYIAKFSFNGTREFSGTVSWDKYTPKMLDAKLCAYIGPNTVDYPAWSQKAPYERSGLQRLVGAMKKQALIMGLSLVTERETKFAVRATNKEMSHTAKTTISINDLPDPTGKPVIILAGEFSGHEGLCLEQLDEPGIFAVSPTTSNRILRLRFDEEFGILIDLGRAGSSN
jgi:hypothetical protein